jgi:nucleoside-diphosphate kinase
MSVQKTLAIIKPDAVRNRHVGEIISMIEEAGFAILAIKNLLLTKDKAREFYAVHKDKPFFASLVDFITSGPVILLALEREDAIRQWRNLMGATDPKNAAAGSIRKKFGANIDNNAVHGSDGPETAHEELALFFAELN